MGFDALFGIVGIIASVVLLLPILVGAIFVILIVSNRADPDPTGRRPAVVYSFAVSFVTLFVTLFASFVIVAELFSLIGTNHSHGGSLTEEDFGSTSDGSFREVNLSPVRHAVGDAVARAVVIAALLAIVAGVLYLLHLRAAQRATAGIAFADPAGRVRSSYIAAVSFVCVIIFAVSVVVGAYQVFRIAGPGVFNSGGNGSRADAVRILLPLIYLAGASFYLLRRHAEQLPPTARPSFRLPTAPPPTFTDTEVDDGPTEVEILET